VRPRDITVAAIRSKWLNRNVLAFGLTSFLSDFCHEMATAVLPQFMQSIGASVAALGLIEGVSDATSSFVKLGAGYHSDRTGHRKGWSVIGYALTAFGTALITFAFAWPLILLARAVGWLGRGIRGPLRDAMLADSVRTEIAGTAFGLFGVVNGIGDFGSSLIVGLLWAGISPTAGFLYAAIVGLAGTILMEMTPTRYCPHGTPAGSRRDDPSETAPF
jgi:sugar phosphate permease